MTGLTVNELKTLFTADITPFEKAARAQEAQIKRLTDTPAEVKVTADTRSALAEVGRLEDRVRRSDESVDVDADTSAAEDKIRGLGDTAAGAGKDGGDRGGAALAGGIVAALATIPIAGAVVGIADTVAKATVKGFQDGLAVEVRADRLAATTGLDEVTVARLGAAAGETYADNFGESIDANLVTARLAVQTRLLDPKSTQRDAEQVITSLSGVADVLEEDVSAVARSTAQLLRTGLAKDAQEAFDIIVAGQQAGLNVSEDWLDTLNEYGTQARNLGLDAPKFLGLLNQAVQAGARDTDIAADALKEYSIRARDVDDTGAREAFEELGFSADEMQRKVAGGRRSAVDALDQTLDRLRKIEDPVKRNSIAVRLFGTQAEDLGAALYAMDLNTAARQFDDLEGSAQRALDTLGDNSAGKVASAERAIEVAADGIKGALAEAFAPQLNDFAEDISQNREAVVQFLLDVANGGIEAGRALVAGAAAGTESFGDFVGQTGPAVLGLIGSILEGFSTLASKLDPIGIYGIKDAANDAFDEFEDMRKSAERNFAAFDAGSEAAADAIRTNIIENGLDPAQEKLNDLGSGLLANAALSDATNRLADDISEVGYAADGSKVQIDLLKGAFDTSTDAGKRLDAQVRAVADSLDDQARAALENGESQKEVRERVQQARQAFIDQVTAMGVTAREAKKLANQYGLIPREVTTRVNLDLAQARADLAAFRASANVRAQIDDGRPRAGRAGGGPIVGPGTGTSDEVPIDASNGEHVVTADEVQAAGGHGAIYRWRAALKAGIAKFRHGGAVGAAGADVRRRRRDLERAVEELRAARGGDGEDAAERRVDRAERALNDARDRLARLREERQDVRTSLRRGEFGGDLGTVDELLNLSRSGDLTRGQSRRLATVGREAERELARLDKRSEQIAKNLERARDRMEDLRDISDDVAGSLRGEFSLAGASNQVNEFGETVSQTQSASGIVGAVRATADRIRRFRDKLKQLVKAGLKGRALDEIWRLGSEEGTRVADEFLADRAQITALNAALRGLDSAAAGAGQAVTEGFFTGGLARAEDLARAAARDQAALDRQYDRIGDRMGRAIAKVLGIKARAGGGPVTAGQPYLVNEDTPNSELFVPGQSGTILNRAQMGAVGAATATFTDAQVAILARAVRDGAAVGLASHERAQDRAAQYVGSL